MAGPSLQVDGARKLRATLKQAGIDVQDLKDAHRAVADLVDREAEPHAPRRSGRLVRTERAAGTQSAAIVRVGRASVPYAGPIHWGWPARHIKPNPWIADAAERSETTWTGTYLHAIETIVNSIEGIPGT